MEETSLHNLTNPQATSVLVVEVTKPSSAELVLCTDLANMHDQDSLK